MDPNEQIYYSINNGFLRFWGFDFFRGMLWAGRPVACLFVWEGWNVKVVSYLTQYRRDMRKNHPEVLTRYNLVSWSRKLDRLISDRYGDGGWSKRETK